MTTIPQDNELLKHLFALLQAHRAVFKRERLQSRLTAALAGRLHREVATGSAQTLQGMASHRLILDLGQGTTRRCGKSRAACVDAGR